MPGCHAQIAFHLCMRFSSVSQLKKQHDGLHATALETHKRKASATWHGFGDRRHEGLCLKPIMSDLHAQMRCDLCMAPTLGCLFDFPKCNVLQPWFSSLSENATGTLVLSKPLNACKKSLNFGRMTVVMKGCGFKPIMSDLMHKGKSFVHGAHAWKAVCFFKMQCPATLVRYQQFGRLFAFSKCNVLQLWCVINNLEGEFT
jgi:hypothetical protein